MTYKTKLSKKCDISASVKKAVYRRDNGECIFCHGPGAPNAHIVPRSHNGLGIETNIITACTICHNKFDNSTQRPFMMEYAENYMRNHYQDWKREDQIYDKWSFLR